MARGGYLPAALWKDIVLSLRHLPRTANSQCPNVPVALATLCPRSECPWYIPAKQPLNIRNQHGTLYFSATISEIRINARLLGLRDIWRLSQRLLELEQSLVENVGVEPATS